jgi:hypothetical protein
MEMMKMTKLYEKSGQNRFNPSEVLELAKTKKLASFDKCDKYAIKKDGKLWTGIWVEIDGMNGKAWHINRPKKIKTYTNLPEKPDWFVLDEFGMPTEKCHRSNKDARYFMRAHKYSGLLRRGDDGGWLDVGAYEGPSYHLGVLVEE